MSQQEQDNSSNEYQPDEPYIDTSSNILNVFQYLFQNNNETDQFSPSSSSQLHQNLNQMQIYFEQQQASSNLLLNHEPTNGNLYSMLDYDHGLYSAQPTIDTKNQFKDQENTDQKQPEPSLDVLILTKHYIDQEILKRKQQNDQERKQQQEEFLLRNKKAKKPQNTVEEDDDEDEDDLDVLSSFSQPLSKVDKRKRNTAASARFRVKKKMREQALQKTAREMTDKAVHMAQRVNDLEKEIKWLRALVVEKNESRIKQLIAARPLNSIAFPINK